MRRDWGISERKVLIRASLCVRGSLLRLCLLGGGSTDVALVAERTGRRKINAESGAPIVMQDEVRRCPSWQLAGAGFAEGGRVGRLPSLDRGGPRRGSAEMPSPCAT